MATLFYSLPALRRVAPRLTREFFTCRQRLQKAPSRPLRPTAGALGRLRAAGLRFNSSHASTVNSNTANIAKSGTPLKLLSQTIRPASPKRFFPETNSKVVAYWLLGSAASVFGIVIFGGLTRLTESGLSITEWRPVTGSLPPMSAADWDSEFAKYKNSPEFHILNSRMTLDDFKRIYYMEWTHRLWGRLVGLSFVIPAAYLVARRKVSAPMAIKLFGIAGLIGFQGFLGWWMVKSGLKDDLFDPGSHPRVSQYRLAAHLGTAFLCYVAMLWNGLCVLREHRLLANHTAVQAELTLLKNPALRPFRLSIAGLAVLIFTTAMSGALVAGLDAGLIYNEFPKMGLGLTPPKSEIFDKFYSRRPDHSDLWWRNMFENPSTVQLDHRILATTTFTAVLSLWAYARFSRRIRGVGGLPEKVKAGVTGVVHLVWMQVALGISTLLYLVPVPLAAAHQAGALALLTGVMVLGSRVWVPKGISRLVAEAAKKGGKVSSGVASGGQTRRSVGKHHILKTASTS